LNIKSSGYQQQQQQQGPAPVSVVVQLACPLKRGDGLVFDAGQVEQLEEGG